jgi:hypothetical protein
LSLIYFITGRAEGVGVPPLPGGLKKFLGVPPLNIHILLKPPLFIYSQLVPPIRKNKKGHFPRKKTKKALDKL